MMQGSEAMIRNSRSVAILAFGLCLLSSAKAYGHDVWDLRVVRNDSSGVTIEFMYEFTPDRWNDQSNILAYAEPSFPGMGWSLWRMQRGIHVGRIDIDCVGGRPRSGRTDRVYIYMNSHGDAFYRETVRLPIQWRCGERGVFRGDVQQRE